MSGTSEPLLVCFIYFALIQACTDPTSVNVSTVTSCLVFPIVSISLHLDSECL
jgi:hypothetical protein